jgi:hypothetical protein
MKKIYDDILLYRNSTSKKGGVRALSSYGKKAIHRNNQQKNTVHK